MLKKQVIIQTPVGELCGMKGIIVAVKNLPEQRDEKSKNIYCKVLVGDKVSNWIPYGLLESVDIRHIHA